MPTLPQPPVETSRRALLAGVVLASGTMASGCTIRSDKIRSDNGRPARPRTGQPETLTPPRDPDIALAATALAGERAALVALEDTLSRHRDLRRTLPGLIEAHRAHVRLLAGAVPESADGDTPKNARRRIRVRKGGMAAVERLVVLERVLSTTAQRQSFAAESGAFARLLASMAAAAAQNAVVLENADFGRPSATPKP